MKQVMFATTLLAVLAVHGAPLEFVVESDNTNNLYKCGVTARLKVTALENGKSATGGEVSVRVDNFGDAVIAERKVALSQSNPFVVTGKLDKPGFLRMTLNSPQGVVTPKGQRGDSFVWGVGYEPEKIKMGSERPADFDEFWAKAVKDLDETVPEDIRMERQPRLCRDGYDVYLVSCATYGGHRTWAMLAEPTDLSRGPYPVTVNVPGAGPAQGDMTGSDKMVNLKINVHYYPTAVGLGRDGPGKEAVHALHKAQNEELGAKYGCRATYQLTGIAKSREDYFYYASLLGANRLVNWLARRKECDRKHFVYEGTSQGGGFGFYLCGLNGNFTKATVFVPAITDLYGFRMEKRMSGWPRLLEAYKGKERVAAEANAAYFDAGHFAAKIEIPIRVYVGFSDVTCPPQAVYAGYNVIPSAEKAIWHGFGMGHVVFGHFYEDAKKWREQEFPVIGEPVVRSMVPSGYGGPNGKYAKYLKRFEQELETAKAGGAPIVFLGDSITHNWEEERHGKAVWERNFANGKFRAVNFGIGGDSTCNVLFRLQHGILDGFKAKVVVFQIGTNNLKNDSPEVIRKGVKACIDEIQKRQPEAVIVLHPVPMCSEKPNDKMRLQAVAANAELPKLVDGKRVVWCEWSHKMLSADGTISKDIIPDTCHPLEKGYEYWAESLIKVLEKVVK